jgi:hypothetical protein
MRRFLVLLAFGALVSGCSLLSAFGPPEPPLPTASAMSPEPAMTAEPTASSATGDITVVSDGSGQSAPFALAGGNYEIRYSATADSPADCTSKLTLVCKEPAFVKRITAGHRNGATFAGNVPAGSGYYIDDDESTCNWQVTLQPLS